MRARRARARAEGGACRRERSGDGDASVSRRPVPLCNKFERNVELREEHLEGVERNDWHRHRRAEDQSVEQCHSIDRRLITSELRLNIDVIDNAEVRRDDASGRRHAMVEQVVERARR